MLLQLRLAENYHRIVFPSMLTAQKANVSQSKEMLAVENVSRQKEKLFSTEEEILKGRKRRNRNFFIKR